MSEGNAYSIRIYVLMVGAVLPLLAAWQLADTIDWYPWLLLLVLGGVISLVVRTRRPAAGYVLLALPLWFTAAGLFANAFLGGSPPERHDSQVLKRTRSSKGPERLILQEFRPGGGELSIHGNSRISAGLAVGQQVTLVVRRGLFGWARIEAIEPRP